MKKYLKDMNILRGIGILLVVLGHSIPGSSDIATTNFQFYQFLRKIIYSFHMPLFFFISGFFATKLYIISSFSDYKAFITSKFKRLMVPYFCVTFLAIPIKLYLNRYALRPANFKSLIVNTLLYPSENPIIFFWFIYTLFLLFVISPVICRIRLKFLMPILLILTFIPMSYLSYLRIFNLNEVVHYIFYFYLGLAFSKFYNRYTEIKNKLFISLICFLSLIVLNTYHSTNIVLSSLVEFITTLVGILGSLTLSYYIKDLKIGNVMEFIGAYSFDIYLLSWFFQSAVRIYLLQVLKLDYNIIVAAMFILGVIGPILLSKIILRKNLILNRFILGNVS